MNLSETQLKILNIIADISDRSTSKGVFDTAVTTHSGLSSDEVYKILSQLASLGLISIDLGGRKPAGADYRIINITKEGLIETSQNQDIR